MVAKKITANSFKTQKLEKTRGRRGDLDRERRLSGGRESARRNDLLPPLQVCQVRLADLRPSPHRTRITTPEQLERVVNAIKALGFSQPILTRGNEIIDGHVRVEAAKRLGLDTVPSIDCGHLTDKECRELALASNRVAELGEWDLDRLRIEFQELIELDSDVMVTGFSSEDQDIILLDPMDPSGEGDDDQDDIPDVGDPVTQAGDLWLADAHRIICGDSREQQTYGALMGDECAHAVLSDPPYNVRIQGNVSGLGKNVHDEFAMASGELNEAEWQQFLDTVIANLATWVVAGAVLFLFMDWRSIHRLYAAGATAKLKVINLVVWYKESGGMGALYRSTHELVAVFCRGDKPHTNNVELGRHGRDRCNVWCAPGANRRGSSANETIALHATRKPVEICVDAILDVTAKGQIVLDAFLGSGTTLVAAEQTGRRCFAIEYEPRFVDVAIHRWARLTGGEAVLQETGETYAQVRARRFADREQSSDTTNKN